MKIEVLADDDDAGRSQGSHDHCRGGNSSRDRSARPIHPLPSVAGERLGSCSVPWRMNKSRGEKCI